ncbi:collectin-10 precursor [Silurus asotus]|uniref:Collectin-10 n=1 Tax=Silurus asotus TaxID=30991 RepID=A0AAD5ALG9_SILAS|nr:collectin-10 precursor [Silurus asotus]
MELLRKTLILLFVLVLYTISSGFSMDICSNTILPGSKGDPGEVGDAGDEGRLGKTGAPGHTGLPGESGEKGDAGRTGKSGPAGERVILGVKETEQKVYLLVKEERKHSDAQLNCRLRGGALALADSKNISTLLGSYINEAGLTHVLVGTGGEPELLGNTTVLANRCTQVAPDGALSEAQCDAQKFYICEFSRN